MSTIAADGAVDSVIDTTGDGVLDFNAYGQPLVVRLSRHVHVGFKYDDFGRTEALQYSTNFESTLDGPRLTWKYDALDRVTRATTPSGSVDISYGKDGLPTSFGISQFGASWQLQPRFNTEGARVSLKYTDGTVVAFGRDSSTRLQSIEPAGTDPVVQNSKYDAGAMVTSRTLGDGLIDAEIGYDANRRQSRRTYKLRATGAILAEVRYARDDAGLITRRQLTHVGTTDYFNFDASQRLKRAVIGVTATLTEEPPAPGTVPTNAYGRTFEYSSTDVLIGSVLENPQRISVASFAGSVGQVDTTLFAEQVTFPGAAIPSVSRSRDEAGNTLTGRGFIRPRAPPSSQLKPGDAFVPVHVTYRYNELGQMVMVSRDDGVTVENTYGPTGLRIRRKVHGGSANDAIPGDLQYFYDGIKLIEIRDLAHNDRLLARFYYGDNGDELIAGDLADPGTSTLRRYYYLTDSLGSPMALVNSVGTVVEYYFYDAWGEATIRPPGAGGTPAALGIHTRSVVDSPFYFQGQVYDEDAGLVYMRARFYDPSLGIYLQPDPAMYKDSVNQYAGMKGNPVNLRDPTGMYAEAGHYYTVYAVALAVGFPEDAAFRTAVFSEAPDEITELDAVNAGIKGGLSMLNKSGKVEYMKSVQAGGHSLSGGNTERERTKRAELILRYKPGSVEYGFAIHAFGDSFTHSVYGRDTGIDVDFDGYSIVKGGPQTQFAPLFGHGAVGHEPDSIGARPKVFERYFRNLHAVMAKGSTGPSRMSSVQLFMELGAVSRLYGEESQILALKQIIARMGGRLDYAPEDSGDLPRLEAAYWNPSCFGEIDVGRMVSVYSDWRSYTPNLDGNVERVTGASRWRLDWEAVGRSGSITGK